MVSLALAFLGLLPYSCTREAQPSSGRYNVSVMLDTRSINTGEVGSIAIYAFSDVNDAEGSGNLVGYLYESNPDASGVFPMTLTDCGAVDFYVILNPDSNCFDFTYADGTTVSIGDTPPSGITPGEIRGWRIKYLQGLDMNTPPSDWMLPMSNLDGTARGNRRFEIEDKPGLQEVPVSVTRAVSKVEVWFRSEDIRSSQDRQRDYWTIQSMDPSDPVKSSGLFTESVEHVPQGQDSFSNVWNHNTYNYLNCVFPEQADESSFYQEKNFTKIFEYYTLPNSEGGNTAGESEYPENCSSLEVGYFRRRYGTDNTSRTKTVYLPAYPRNSCIRVWCALPGTEDMTFTYTVIDWDETVTVNIPDFS